MNMWISYVNNVYATLIISCLPLTLTLCLKTKQKNIVSASPPGNQLPFLLLMMFLEHLFTVAYWSTI